MKIHIKTISFLFLKSSYSLYLQYVSRNDTLFQPVFAPFLRVRRLFEKLLAVLFRTIQDCSAFPGLFLPFAYRPLSALGLVQRGKRPQNPANLYGSAGLFGVYRTAFLPVLPVAMKTDREKNSYTHAEKAEEQMPWSVWMPIIWYDFHPSLAWIWSFFGATGTLFIEKNRRSVMKLRRKPHKSFGVHVLKGRKRR